MSWIDELIHAWKNDGLSIAKGADEEEIKTFERQHSVGVPKPFRDYLLTVNGMASAADTDGRLFAFWPLAQMKPVLGEYPAYSDQAQDWFMFADFMIHSFEFAIDMSADPYHRGRVILAGEPNPQVIARTFPEFISLYLRDAREIYGSK